MRKNEKRPDVFPTLAETVKQKRSQLVVISSMMIGVCQQAISVHHEYRRFFALEMTETNILRNAPPERVYYISNRCLYPWRPSRPITEILDKGPTMTEARISAEAMARNDGIINDLKIMWSAYIFAMQRFLRDNPDSWQLLGISRADSQAMVNASLNALHKLVGQGPYIMTPSSSLRGLLNPDGSSVRHDELLRRSALDLSVKYPAAGT